MRPSRPFSFSALVAAIPATALTLSACGGAATTPAPPTCSLTVCPDACVDTQSDARNCGGCGRACGTDEVCLAGECALHCPAGQVQCGAACVDPRYDPGACGARGACSSPEPASADYEGARCEAGLGCLDGACAPTCPSGQIVCEDVCVNRETDPLHCGARGHCSSAGASSPDYAGAACGPGETCQGGTCALSCPPEQVLCDAACVNPATSQVYCGADAQCGGYAVCSAHEICHEGTCTAVCLGGQTACPSGGSTVCVDLDRDPVHCGQCDVACATHQACFAGACTNFATWDPAASTAVLSGDDLQAVVPPGTLAVATVGRSTGKWYWEFLPTQFGGSGMDRTGIIGVGVKGAVAVTGNGVLNASGWGAEFYTDDSSYLCIEPGTVVYNPMHYPAGAVIGVALNLDPGPNGGTLAFYVDGVYQGIAFTGLAGQMMYPIYSNDDALFNNTEATTVNFGATPLSGPIPDGYQAGFY